MGPDSSSPSPTYKTIEFFLCDCDISENDLFQDALDIYKSRCPENPLQDNRNTYRTNKELIKIVKELEIGKRWDPDMRIIRLKFDSRVDMFSSSGILEKQLLDIEWDEDGLEYFSLDFGELLRNTLRSSLFIDLEHVKTYVNLLDQITFNSYDWNTKGYLTGNERLYKQI